MHTEAGSTSLLPCAVGNPRDKQGHQCCSGQGMAVKRVNAGSRAKQSQGKRAHQGSITSGTLRMAVSSMAQTHAKGKCEKGSRRSGMPAPAQQ